MNSLNFPASQFYWNSNFEYSLSNESINLLLLINMLYAFTFFYQNMWITLSRPSTSQLSTKNVNLYYRWCSVLVLIFLFCFRPETNRKCYNWDVIFLSLSSEDGEKYQKGPKLLSLKLQTALLAFKNSMISLRRSDFFKYFYIYKC